MTIDILLGLFNTITSILTAQYFFSLFAEKKEKNVLVSVCVFGIFFLSLQVVTSSLVNMLILGICIFILSINYKFNIYSKIIFSFIFLTLNILVETISGVVLSNAFEVDAQTAHIGMFAVFGSLLSKIVFIMICFVIGFFKKRTLIGQFRFNWLPIYVLPISTMFVTYVLYISTFYYDNDNALNTLSIASLIMLIISNLWIIKLINHIHDSALKETRLETAEELVKQQEKQYGLLIENNETIVRLRHDYKNFLVGMLSMLTVNMDNNSDIRNALEKELDIVEKASNKNICGNSIIDSIMNYKTSEAKAKGINIEFEHKNTQKIVLPGVDLAILLGNTLDNAIEASEKLDGKKSIEVSIKCMAEQIVISVINRVGEDIDTENMKSSKGFFHGYGIMNMRSVAAKYDGSISFSCENKLFMTIIILNVK